MFINSDSTGFQSKIKFINYSEFLEKTKNLNPKKHQVGYPWQPFSRKNGKNLYTTGIQDCIAIGLVDGKKSTLFHICTAKHGEAKKLNLKGFDIKQIEHRILESVDLTSKNLHAIILGGHQIKDASKYNVKHLNKIKKILDDNKIPYSIFGARRDVHCFGKYSMLYSTKEDTWYISNNLTNRSALGGMGKEIEALGDIVRYNTYRRIDTPRGVQYNRTRKATGVLDFFESQFRQVSVSKFDEIA
ncbi:hypothetical protein IJ750_00605 [bacterium]|nr:hypothetical protein [bacterium]